MSVYLPDTQLAQAPGLLSFLPILFVAWSDDVLTPTQAEIIRKTIEAQPWVSDDEKVTLARWLDPGRPPSAEQVKTWLRIIRNTADQIPDASRKTLGELGIQIATNCATGDCEKYLSPQAASALKKVESALEVETRSANREMLLDLARPLPPEKEEIPPASFDIAGLSKLLDGPESEVMRKVRLVLADPVFSLDRVTSNKEVYRETVLEWCKLLANQGFGALSYPLTAGGNDDLSAYIAVFETLGYHDLSLLVKFGVQFGLFGISIQQLGTEAHHKAYLPAVGTLDLPGCFAMTESGHGSNVRDIETTAIYDPENQEFVIHTPTDNARKDYIGNAAAHGKMATVFAQLYTQGECYGVHAFLVPIRDDRGDALPGIRIEDCGEKLGLNGVDNGRIWFEEVRIPRENLLNRFGDVTAMGNYSSPIPSESRRFFTMLGTLVGGRVCVPIAGLSAAKKALAIAIRYGDKRRQFGPAGAPEVKILDYRTHQRRLMPLLAKAYALHFAHRHMINLFIHHGEEEVREVEAIAAGLKAVSTWNTTRTIQECREACGGNGYLRVNQFADMKADTEVFTTFEGDNVVLMQLVAKGRLQEFKREFRDLNFVRIAQWVGNRAAVFFSELNPLVTGNKNQEHLRSAEFQLNAFRYREEDLVRSAAQRLKSRLDDGMEGHLALIECQDHLVTMAHAYIDRIILEKFIFASQSVPDESIRRTLQQLRGLYALSSIEENRGWYLEQGYIDGSKSKAIRREVNLLCAEVRKDAVALVDAFGIPEASLAAPIAL